MSIPRITLIAAVSEDGFISRGKGVPWDIAEDRRHFRDYTKGKWLLLGRKTFEEMHGWFREDHTPLALTRDETFTPQTGRAVLSIEHAIAMAEQGGAEELVVCGGGATYEAAMPHADTLIITHVAQRLGDGVRFPVIDEAAWKITSKTNRPGFCITRYQKRGQPE